MLGEEGGREKKKKRNEYIFQEAHTDQREPRKKYTVVIAGELLSYTRALRVQQSAFVGRVNIIVV